MTSDFNSVRAQLEPLSVRHWAAFAASCAERQFGTYQFVSRGDPRLKPELVRRALDVGWAFAGGEPIPESRLTDLKHEVDPLIPDLDDDRSGYASLVLDAVGAVSHLLDVCLNGNVDSAASAGESARNAVDEFILFALHASPDDKPTPITVRPGEYEILQQRIDSHPMMERENWKQQSDLEYLRAHPLLGMEECRRLRQSWVNGTKSNIDLD